MSRRVTPSPISAAGLALLLALLPRPASRAAAPGPAPAPPSAAASLPALPPSGFHHEPLVLRAQPPAGAQWRFTTNGSLPSATQGNAWTGELRLTHTAVLRLAAVSGAASPKASPGIVTRTYLFPRQVIGQTGEGFPATWGVREGRPVPADYAMDPEIVRGAAYATDIERSMTALPSLSVVLAPDELFGAVRGIYSHPMETGGEWERAASFELLGDPAVIGPVDGGIRIQGGWNRRPEESPKHAFRLVFRKRYGPAQWKAPVFGAGAPVEFDDLILRAGCNNTWLHWSGDERARGEYLRDQWMRDSLAAMGHPSARGRFVHLYLNGLYWGIYNLTERPSAPFVAAHLGGKPSRYDVRNGDEPISGDGLAWDDLMKRLNGTVPGTAVGFDYAAVSALVAMAPFIDYLLLNLYGANHDLDGASNWYAARRREPPGPFHFFVWDGERTLEDPDASILDADPENSPLRLFQRLRGHPQFRDLFRERARLHLTGDGALTPARAGARYERLASKLDPAIAAESARWGDYRRDVHPYKVGPYALHTRDEHWRPEVKRLLDDYFPRRTRTLVAQLRAADLFPAAD